MNPGGLVLISIGVVALCQIFGGQALQRLKVIS
jgi:hypothetical protein